MCPTCPFSKNGDLATRQKVEQRCLTDGSQICHHPALHGKEQTNLCRGARNYQQQIFHRMGVIEAATDEAWSKAMDAMGL